MTPLLGPALVIVDVQKAFDTWERRGERRNNPGALDRIAELLSAFREAKLPVFHIRHRGTSPASLFQGEAFDPIGAAREQGGEAVLFKTVNSAFIGTGLEGCLRTAGVGTVVICGATSNHCVETTTRMAGNLGFDARFVRDATWTFDRVGPDGQLHTAATIQAMTEANLSGEFAEIVTAAEVAAALRDVDGGGAADSIVGRRLHGTERSGHTHRVALLLRMLGLSYEFVPAPAEVRCDPEFRALNPLGQIPVLEDGPTLLADSAAILVYLATRYAPDGGWLPRDPIGASQVQRWLSVAAGELKGGPAAARLIRQWSADGDLDHSLAVSERLLAFMEAHLSDRPYLALDRPTIADLACYSYVAHAPEGGIPLGPYPAVRGWLERVASLPGFFPMPPSPIPSMKLGCGPVEGRPR